MRYVAYLVYYTVAVDGRTAGLARKSIGKRGVFHLLLVLPVLESAFWCFIDSVQSRSMFQGSSALHHETYAYGYSHAVLHVMLKQAHEKPVCYCHSRDNRRTAFIEQVAVVATKYGCSSLESEW